MSNTSCLLSNCMAWREISEMLMTSAHATWQLECQTHARMNLVQDPTRIRKKKVIHALRVIQELRGQEKGRVNFFEFFSSL